MTIELIAHRGTGKGWRQSQQPPENTLPALRAAWEAGYPSCELDVRATADGHLLVIHDATTGRTGSEDLAVAAQPLSALQALDAGSWKSPRWAGIRFPTLPDVLAALPPDGRLYIEVKDGPAGTIAPLAAAIEAAGIAPERLAIISFVWETLIAARQALPGVAAYLLVEFQWDPVAMVWTAQWCESIDGRSVRPVCQRPADTGALIEKVAQAGLAGLDVSADQPPDFAEQMQQAGLPWVVWTVGDPRTAVEMAHRGAAGITTDQPDRVRAALHRSGFETR